MKKIECVAAICVPLFFMASCNNSKKTPEKRKPGSSEESNVKRRKVETQVSSQDVKRETGEALETTKTYLAQQKRNTRRMLNQH